MRSLLFVSLLLFASLLFAGCKANDVAQTDPSAGPFLEAMHLAYSQGDLGAALASADSALQYAPALQEVEYVRGQILTDLRQFDAADSVFQKLLASDPQYIGGWYRRGHNAFMQRKYREALTYYQKEATLLEQAGAEDTEAGHSGLPSVTAQIGRTYALLGVPDSARIAYQKAITSDSLLADAHAWYSEILDEAGDLNNALKHAKIALQGKPHEVEYGYRVGLLLFQMGQPREALPYLSRVVQILPGHEGAHFNLGRALQVLGQEEQGQVYINRIPEIRKLQEDAQMAERRVEIFPKVPRYWIELADYMVQLGYMNRAEAALNAAHTLSPGEPSLQSDLANMAFSRGDTTTAIARYEQLLQEHPTFTTGWLNLGVMHAMSGNNDAAREAWQTVLKHKPDDEDAKSYLAQLDE